MIKGKLILLNANLMILVGISLILIFMKNIPGEFKDSNYF